MDKQNNFPHYRTKRGQFLLNFSYLLLPFEWDKVSLCPIRSPSRTIHQRPTPDPRGHTPLSRILWERLGVSERFSCTFEGGDVNLGYTGDHLWVTNPLL
ncbi:hypothetical protein TNIN_124691 [Trichonephila inaurata madagascariensis]|uniref:Uncharacterized protein n=1 Tax=Trichonephila inaurata madagascariensis TaxID=2747483 RepID=A0A8X6WTP0_9ARAC|nr:hypothetical protein TNIN_124691 [Trichonephila inaurata madagascariensis]